MCWLLNWIWLFLFFYSGVIRCFGDGFHFWYFSSSSGNQFLKIVKKIKCFYRNFSSSFFFLWFSITALLDRALFWFTSGTFFLYIFWLHLIFEFCCWCFCWLLNWIQLFYSLSFDFLICIESKLLLDNLVLASSFTEASFLRLLEMFWMFLRENMNLIIFFFQNCSCSV